ncbi:MULTISPECIES: hypothetical protein [Acinetobacter]|uniref:Uncharacterized protein n=1 Tax=Acinetobacter indicus TaxID=756892 RepID=A0A6C0Y6V5_9GAMM|nr:MULTISPECIES: hypothetical protein [Acinetobacter]QIC71866.1 hypothetical protein FSC09_15870 [Acinetobacter indicus]QKQ71402.1 hypothetical protein E5Y90_14320 [Acinetobacter sp. 10FS3-1]
MWESISTICAIVSAVLFLIFLLLLVEKAAYTKSGFFFQGAVLISAALFGSLYYYVSSNKVEISTYQYAQIYDLYKDESKDYIIKNEIRRGLSDGMFSKSEFNKLKANHLESLNYAEAMNQFAEVLPNIEIEYSTPTQKLSVNMSMSIVYMMRIVFIMGFFLFASIYLLSWNQYCTAIRTKTKLNDILTIQAIDRWNFMQSKKGLQIVGLVLSLSAIGLVFTELYFNDVTSATKAIVVSYGEANKNVPMIYETVQSALVDSKITADEYSKIENLEQNVVVEYIKQSIQAIQVNELKPKSPDLK